MGLCYVGKCKGCGAILAATDAEKQNAEQVAEDVAQFVREGLLVESSTDDTVRLSFGGCTCRDK